MKLGMGSALETLCGQAFGAGQLDMLGVYMQRSWVILNSTALLLSLLYIFATPILKLIGETSAISEAAGNFNLISLFTAFHLTTKCVFSSGCFTNLWKYSLHSTQNATFTFFG